MTIAIHAQCGLVRMLVSHGPMWRLVAMVGIVVENM